jgi:hypothetical protein
VEDSTPMQVLADIGRELVDVRASIFAVLAKSPRTAETWQIFERGYLCVFLEITRIKLFTTSLLQCVAPGPGSLQTEGSRFVKDDHLDGFGFVQVFCTDVDI